MIDPDFTRAAAARAGRRGAAPGPRAGRRARRLPARAHPQPDPPAARRGPRGRARRRRPRPARSAWSRRHLGLRRRHRPDARRRPRGSPSRPSQVAAVSRRRQPRADRAGRRAGRTASAPGSRRTRSTRSTSDAATRSRCSPTGAAGCSPTTASTTSTRALLQVQGEQVLRRPRRAPSTTQQRVRLQPVVTAVGVDGRRRFETMRTLAPPVGRGWEYLTGDRLGLGRRAGRSSPSCSPRSSPRRRSRRARYDLVIDPSNLWLTIHESIGHATELDRALGYEAAYAGHLVRHARQARARCGTARRS